MLNRRRMTGSLEMNKKRIRNNEKSEATSWYDRKKVLQPAKAPYE